MSDDDEGGYNTVRQTHSGKGVKLLYSKSKVGGPSSPIAPQLARLGSRIDTLQVYVHPTPSAKDNIPGFIALVQQKGPASPDRPTSSASASSGTNPTSSSSLLLAWVPESSLPSSAYDAYVKVDLSEDAEPPRQSYLVPTPPTTSTSSSSSPLGTYAFAVPVSEIYSLLVRPPSVGWWYGSVIINTRAGGGLPALFFHDSECQSTILQRKRRTKESFDPFGDAGGTYWGGDEVLRWLKQYVTVERAEHDLNVYLVEPSEEDRLGFGTQGERAMDIHDSTQQQRKTGPASRQSRDAAMDPFTKTLKEARWGLLEKFSQVTTFARRAAQNVADHPSMPPQAKRLIQNPEVQTIQEEFDSARLYLARWAMSIAEQSERERSQRIWTAKDVLEMEETPVGDFEILDMETGGLSMADRRRPVTMEEWETFFNPTTGALQVTVDEVKQRIFHGGLHPDDGVRKEAWLFLLGVYDWRSTCEERQATTNSRRDEYVKLKGKWWERLADNINKPSSPAPGSSTSEERQKEDEQRTWWKDQRQRIEKDVHRTDRHVGIFAGEDIPHPDPDSPFAEVGTNVHLEQMKDMLLTYNEYNQSLGYVQGMSDLLAPIYAVMQDDALAFWGFVGFMKRMVSLGLLIVHIYAHASTPTLVTSLTDNTVGTQLPPLAIRHAYTTSHPRPPCSTHGSRPLLASPARRLNQLLLLFPHAPCLVQARVCLARCIAAVGNPLDGLLQRQLPCLYCIGDIGEASERDYGASEGF